MKIEVQFKLNGKEITLTTEANKRLLDVLREDLQLTGTKEGCAIGECGACTVIMNGEAVTTCLILIGQVQGAEIITIEGLSEKGELHPLQQKFLEHGAVQCGYCTPGMLLSAYTLLLKTKNPTEEEIKEAIAGNLCRCTGYKQIIEAVRETELK